MDIIREAGFNDVQRGSMVDVFSGSPRESDARDFDTRGMTVRAVKPSWRS